MGFLDSGGLTHLWGKIQTALAGKLDKSGGSTEGFSLLSGSLGLGWMSSFGIDSAGTVAFSAVEYEPMAPDSDPASAEIMSGIVATVGSSGELTMEFNGGPSTIMIDSSGIHGNDDFGTFRISGTHSALHCTTPTIGDMPTTKDYVDTALEGKLDKTGGEMTGELSFAAKTGITLKSYDSESSTTLSSKIGTTGSLTVTPLKPDGTGMQVTVSSPGAFSFDRGAQFKGPISLNGNRLYNVAEPELVNDAANKKYVDSAISAALPAGVITMWSGAADAIPVGWALCNGANGTPDLRDRFVVGAGSTYSVGAKGGEATHTLTTNEMPNHSHGIYYQGSASSGASGKIVTSRSGYQSTSSTTSLCDSAGRSQAHNNLPPYYALCYIMKL